MYDQTPADVPRTSHHLIPGTSRNWVPQTSRGRPHLELLNICFSSEKQQQMCKTKTIASKNTFFIKSSIFLLVPQSPLKVPWRSQTLGRPRNVACQLGYLQKQGLEAVNSFLKNIPSEMSSMVVNTPLDKLRSLLHVKIKCQLTNSFRRSCSLCSVYKFLLKVTILVHFYFLGSLN